MKFDDHLAQYLYENKSLKLQGIGTFSLDGKVSLPSEHEKEIYYPIEGLAFNYNPKEVLDEDLVAFLVKRLGKIQPLVRSDLDSYLSNIKQFINLGKPYTIEGVGTLNKNNHGTYEFTPGNFLPAKEELNPKRENADHNYPTSSGTSAGKVFVIVLIILASLAALGGIGWGISTLLSKKTTVSEQEQQQTGQVDTIATQQPATSTVENSTPKDTATTPVPTSTIPTSTVTNSDSVGYKMIFEITPSKQRALTRTERLNVLHIRSKYDTLRSNGVLNYRLFVPVKIRPQDTLHYKDSLFRWFARKIIVDKL